MGMHIDRIKCFDSQHFKTVNYLCEVPATGNYNCALAPIQIGIKE